jgi:hypothetical protein
MFVSPTSPFTLVEDIGSDKGGLYGWGKTKFTFYSAELDMNDPAYQVVYGVGLLDDVHNYFPALLYDQGRFQNITNIFSYVRSQLNNRFNLYAYGARLAQAQAQGQAQPSSFSPAPVYTTTTTPPPMVRSFRGGASDNEVMASASFLLNMLNLGLEGEAGFTPLRAGTFGAGAGAGAGAGPGTAGTAGTGGIWAAFRAPVIVAPSTAVLASNTSILNASDVSNNLVGVVCTICQDTVVPTDLCRRLNACQHVYHKACIDEWFTRSVFCPSCRHDVREPRAASPMLQGVPSAPNLSAVPSSPLVAEEPPTTQ